MNSSLAKLGSAGDRAEAADVVAELRHQHARIIELIGELGRSADDRRLAKLMELREYMIMHETAEQVVVRPVISEILGEPAELDEGDECVALAACCDGEKRAFMGRQLRAAETGMRDPGTADRVEPLNVIVERTYRAIRAETGKLSSRRRPRRRAARGRRW